MYVPSARQSAFLRVSSYRPAISHLNVFAIRRSQESIFVGETRKNPRGTRQRKATTLRDSKAWGDRAGDVERCIHACKCLLSQREKSTRFYYRACTEARLIRLPVNARRTVVQARVTHRLYLYGLRRGIHIGGLMKSRYSRSPARS